MPRREIKKTVISYQEKLNNEPNQVASPRQRSRDKNGHCNVEVVDQNSRRQKLAALRKAKQQEQSDMPVINYNLSIKMSDMPLQQPALKQEEPIQRVRKTQTQGLSQANEIVSKQNKIIEVAPKKQSQIEDAPKQQLLHESSENQSGDEQSRKLLKPIFIPKQNREEEEADDQRNLKEIQRKRKALKYTTKMLLIDNAREEEDSEDEQMANSSDEQMRVNLPEDDDTTNEELQYELWKIRELKRIRREKEERRKIFVDKSEVERRRKMDNEEILLENKVMGSDATDNPTETKYVYMQKYYHKGAFYQDSQDSIHKRNYNLPTPLEMQDKGMLPEIMQKRQGNFGAKGQSKYKHLTAEDTTNFDPQFRPDEALMNGWKKKMAGYKASDRTNI